MTRFFCISCLSLWLLFSGCSETKTNKDWLPTHPAKGRVTINGTPAAGAIVRLYPIVPQADSKSPVVPTGTVGEDGTFVLTTYTTGDGAPEGDYQVTLAWPDPQLNMSKGGMPEDPPDRLRNRFANPERSKLKAHISAGENELDPIVLEKVELLSRS